ncbi:hypothetical protein INT43_004972 [Umbelopsis isabellina]|uniref:Uncharacterized protein n=1 Tax=Mortierella isabellina TaxID=91625 RepID=A0A8H7U7Y9_MORIS|nr:hypothetical protein INT43_004972 [Umbelopsis isabellina]
MTSNSLSASNTPESDYISSISSTPRIQRFQARLADAATSLRSLSQEEDDMFLEPCSPQSASSESTLDRMDHIVDDPILDNPFVTHTSFAKQAASKKRRSIKYTKAVEIEQTTEESPLANRRISRSRRSSTVSSLTSLDDVSANYSLFDEKIANAAAGTSIQKRSIRNLNGFGSVSRAKRRKLKTRNVVDPKLWAHSQDTNQASVRVDLDEDQSGSFTPGKQSAKSHDSTKRRIRGNKRDTTRVIIGNPAPHRVETRARLPKLHDHLDVKLERLRKQVSATELDLSSHSIVPDSLEEVLQSESLSIRSSSQRTLDSKDDDSPSSSVPFSSSETVFPASDLFSEDGRESAPPEMITQELSLGVEDATTTNFDDSPDKSTITSQPQVTCFSPTETLDNDTNDARHTSTLKEDLAVQKQMNRSPERNTEATTDSEVSHAEAIVDHNVIKNEVKQVDELGSFLQSPSTDSLEQTEAFIESDDNESVTSEESHHSTTNQSSYLRQLASSMSRFILG